MQNQCYRVPAGLSHFLNRKARNAGNTRCKKLGESARNMAYLAMRLMKYNDTS